MHPLLRRSLAALASVGLFQACDAGVECPGDWCGTAVIAVPGEAGSLFPPSGDTNIEFALIDFVFAKLADIGTELDPTDESAFVPRLAASWDWIDAATLRFRLDREARWHDGAPVTAQDVAFTFDVYRDTLVGAVARGRLDRILAVHAQDQRSVVFRFRERYAEALFDAVYHMRILPRHLLDSVPRARLAQHPFGRQPVGAGPYRFVRWEAGQYVELVGDPGFVRGRPGIPRIVWRFAPDVNSIVTQVVAGETDATEFLGSPANVERVRASPHARVVEYPAMAYGYIAFNFRDPADTARPHPLFADRALRRALAMAVDRAAAVRAVLGPHGHPAAGPLTRTLAVWHDSLEPPPFDSVAARRELERLGWIDRDGDGVRERAARRLQFELLVPSTSGIRMLTAEVIQDQLRRQGIDMQIAALDFEATFARARNGRFDAVYGGYLSDPSPGSIADVWTSAGIGGFNYGRYVSPTVERLAERATHAQTQDEAIRLWRAAIGEINADAPAIFVYEPVMTAAVHSRFDGVVIRPDQWTALLWTWRIPAARRIDRDRFGVR